jgi:hypothetical protein
MAIRYWLQEAHWLRIPFTRKCILLEETRYNSIHVSINDGRFMDVIAGRVWYPYARQHVAVEIEPPPFGCDWEIWWQWFWKAGRFENSFWVGPLSLILPLSRNPSEDPS